MLKYMCLSNYIDDKKNDSRAFLAKNVLKFDSSRESIRHFQNNFVMFLIGKFYRDATKLYVAYVTIHDNGIRCE